MRQLAGRVAVVTGAVSGIGRALAARFAAEGMRCVLADIEEPAPTLALASARTASGPQTRRLPSSHRSLRSGAPQSRRRRPLRAGAPAPLQVRAEPAARAT
jgi:NAD(P)-dependent dehydrogenase (short-subunit alcohol dehydrogenase family)